jgi:hypothetical protein
MAKHLPLEVWARNDGMATIKLIFFFMSQIQKSFSFLFLGNHHLVVSISLG